jgi:membrane protein implicated in regulation of membrane protease activity
VQASAQSRRRWFGALCLAGALLLLLGGQTLLAGRLTGVPFILYWLLCFGLTVLAMLAAWLDVIALRRESRARQRDLVESTVHEILAAKKPAPGKRPPPPG